MKKPVLRPTILTIFGITGDLAAKYLIPALYQLKLQGMLPGRLFIVGFARREWSDEFLKKYMRDVLSMDKLHGKHSIDKQIIDSLLAQVHYVQGDFNSSQDYQKLTGFMDQLEQKHGRHLDKLFYLATAPEYYASIFEQLGKCGLAHSTAQELSKIMIEKPFGSNAKSAQQLNKVLLKHFKEQQIYRIDHYLGKEPVQNLLAFRFGNGLFEHLWSSKHIDNIQVSATMENLGIGRRGSFYEQTGALLDVVQNHVLQLVALVTMDEPYSLDAEHVRDKKYQLLKKVHVETSPGYVIKGQYAAGSGTASLEIPGYRQEKSVAPKSTTETFTALKLAISDPRWRGMPIYVRTGKRVDKHFTEINIEFKQPQPHFLGHTDHKLLANVLTIRIQPEESISLRLMVKQPDFGLKLVPVQMIFRYDSHFLNQLPGAYERIIYEAFLGSQMLFVRSDSVLQQWKIIDKVKRNWAKHPLEFYAAGSSGPKGQDRMLAKDGKHWW